MALSSTLDASTSYPVHSFRLSVRGSTRSGRCTAATMLAAPNTLDIQFNLPYRVSFGQSLSIVGSSSELGNWDVDRRVPMQWSAGDVWRAEVQAPHDIEALEYKYVVVEPDGNISCWKPGDNVRLTLRQVPAASIAVRDAWDGSVHEVWPQQPEDKQQEQASPFQSGPGPQPTASAPAAAAAPPKPRPPPPPAPAPPTAASSEQEDEQATSVFGNDVDDAVQLALQRAFSELESTLQFSLQLVDDAADPSDPRLLMNDQKLAAVTRRAISLSKALEAGAPPPAYILKNLNAKKELKDTD